MSEQNTLSDLGIELEEASYAAKALSRVTRETSDEVEEGPMAHRMRELYGQAAALEAKLERAQDALIRAHSDEGEHDRIQEVEASERARVSHASALDLMENDALKGKAN